MDNLPVFKKLFPNCFPLCHTLRCWVHEILILFLTFSPRLGSTFPYIKYILPCMDICQKYISLYRSSQIAERRPTKIWKIWDRHLLIFRIFTTQLKSIHTMKCSFYNCPYMATYILCMSIIGTSFQCIIVPQLRGEDPKKDQHFMPQGSQSVLCIHWSSMYILLPPRFLWRP